MTTIHQQPTRIACGFSGNHCNRNPTCPTYTEPNTL